MGGEIKKRDSWEKSAWICGHDSPHQAPGRANETRIVCQAGGLLLGAAAATTGLLDWMLGTGHDDLTR